MRFYEFEMPENKAWIDLDCIHAICPDAKGGHPDDRTIVATPNGALCVIMPIAQVLALVKGDPQFVPSLLNPPFEVQFVEPPPEYAPDAGLHAKTEAVNKSRFARIDELSLFDKALQEARSKHMPSFWLEDWIRQRRMQIHQGDF